ncbi:MAG TPA: 4Fe-4S dicluster domain-containing protein [Trebonia sp.]|nr:4Fe-4S dicluster domain-containing protein [Trebonia sp.]
MAETDLPSPRWAKLLDQSRCIGCHACTTACKSENEVPVGVTRTYVKSVDVGTFPQARRAFQVTRCNQCEDAPCVAACPTEAMYRRPDGIVDFDKRICIGCKACMAACPYDAIFINPEDHSAEKCNLCAHRLDIGLEPACVTVCPTEAIIVGDLGDPASEVSRVVSREPVQVRRPEKGTRPGVYYKGAHAATLDPLAARRPGGGLFAWATQGREPAGGRSPASQRAPQTVTSGHPGRGTSQAAALLSYDVPHQVPWGWRVSLYTWTKSVAAGGFAVPVLLAGAGYLGWGNDVVRWAAPLLALAFLAVTGALLVADLKHPARFYLIFTRRHWRSWLVRGAVILGGFGAIAAAYLAASLAGAGAGTARQGLGWAGLPLALAAAVYTAFLFGQAKGRDLWQSPLLAPHLAVQAALAGAAAVLPLLAWLAPGRAVTADQAVLAVAAGVHAALVAGEVAQPHATAHARLAVHEMTLGSQRLPFGISVVLTLAAVAAPWIGTPAAALALAGLLGYEHAYVQAGQRVPLA